MFKVGDNVITPDGQKGCISFVWAGSNATAYTVNFKDGHSYTYHQSDLNYDHTSKTMNEIWDETEITETKPVKHECKPYVGISHIENVCGECGKFMSEDKVNEYRKKL